MNERLKELADKSGFGPAWYDPTIPTSDIDRRWIDQSRLKEFAELIVNECAMFVVTELEGKVGSLIADATANRLEEHFGVKE